MLCRCELVRRSLSLFTCCVCLALNSFNCQPIYPRSPLTLSVANASSPSSPAPLSSSLLISLCSPWAVCFGSLREKLAFFFFKL